MPTPTDVLRPYLDRIATLPAWPWFSEANLREAQSIIAESNTECGGAAGLEMVITCEVLDRTVNGLKWSRTACPSEVESPSNLANMEKFLFGAALPRIELQSVFLHIAGLRVHLAGDDLLWWQRYESLVLESFGKFGVSIQSVAAGDIAFLVDNEDYDYLVGLLQLGLSARTLRAGIPPHMRLASRIIASAKSGWRDEDWK